MDLGWTLYHRALCLLLPRHPTTLTLRAERALENEAWGQAFDLSHAALRRRPERAEPLYLRGVARLHLDDYDGAFADLSRFLSLVPAPPAIVYFWRGWIYAQREEWRLAQSDFERLRRADPDEPLAQYWLAYVAWQRRDWARMEEALTHFRTLQPGNPLGAELSGHLHLQRGEVEEAESAYSRALAHGRLTTDLLYNRAVARRQLGRGGAAREDLRRVLALEPHNPWAHIQLCQDALERDEPAAALEHARLARRYGAADIEAWLCEAGALMAGQEWQAAHEVLEKIDGRFPENPRVAAWQGDVLLALERPEAALQAYHRALRLAPTEAGHRLAVAETLIALKRFPEAAPHLDEILHAAPDHPGALAARADLYRHTNRPDAMRADLDRLVAAEPDHGWALIFRAVHRAWSGDETGAAADFDAALAAEGGQGWMWAFRGRFHVHGGRLDRARADFGRAITLDPEDPWIRRQWALFLQRRGATARAAQVLDCLVADHPDDDFARLARAHLALEEGAPAAATPHFIAIAARDGPLAWLAHAALAAYGGARTRHLARAKALRPTPTFWGASPALVAAQRALCHWLEDEPEAAGRALDEAVTLLEPGERLWPALVPLLQELQATPLLERVAARVQQPTATR